MHFISALCLLFVSVSNLISLLLREYDPTESVFVNSYPWLFPGGIGDLYDMERGQLPCVKEWGRHLLHYYDGRFSNDQMFSLFLFNTIERHNNNTQGNFFFKSEYFIGKNPPTIENLKEKLAQGDDKYIQMLRYFARDIKGGDNYWRNKTHELECWINHHVAAGRGPPTFFVTFSCAENWWPDLRRILQQLEEAAGREYESNLLKNNNFRAMQRAARRYPLFVNDFFMKRARHFMDTVMKGALGIDHYWGRVEFAPGRGQIHLHMLCIAKDRAYLDAFYDAKSMEDKAKVLDDYARTHFDMTADVDIKDDDRNYHAPHPESPLAKKFCECEDEDEDVKLLAQDCMCHHCNQFCLEENKANTPRSCRAGFGDEKNYNQRDTPGLNFTETSVIEKDKKGYHQFKMRRTHSKRVVQHSKTLLKGWRGNVDLKFLLYFSDPRFPDIGEIEEVCKYVVAYTGKRQKTTRQEKDAIQNLILR